MRYSHLQRHLLQFNWQHRLLCGIVFCFVSGYSLHHVSAQDVNARYFEQLRKRHLFSLAEGICLTELKKEKLSVAKRSRMTLELARTFTAHANFVNLKEQADLWKQAEDVLTEYLQKNPQLPGRMLLDIQLAKIPAAEANWYRWEVKLASGEKSLISKSNALFNRSITRWSALQKHLDEQLKLRLKKKKGNDTFSLFELRLMLNDVRLQYAITALDHAELAPLGSEVRKQRLRDAEKPLQFLKNGADDDVRTWQSRLQLARAGRLRHDFKTATAILKIIEADHPPKQIIPQLVAEQVQFLLESNKPFDAAQFLIEKRKVGVTQTGLLRFLNIQSLIATAQIAKEKKNNELAQGIQKQIEGYVKRTTIEVGGFWGYRSQTLFNHLKQNIQFGEKVAGLIRQAERAIVSNQNQEAIRLYGEATIIADQTGRKEVAMDLGFKRASIQLQSEDHAAAAVSFIELSKHFSQSKRTADAHLLGAYSLGRIYLASKYKEDREEYTKALTHHIQQFNKSPTAFEAMWMFATLQEQLSQTTTALKWYQQIPTDNKRSPLAQLAVARCYQTLLSEMQKTKQPLQVQQKLEQVAISQLTRYAKAHPTAPQKLTDRQTELLLRLAQIELKQRQPDFTQADRLLLHIIKAAEAHLEQKTEGSLILPTWKPLKKNAVQLRILSLTGQKKYDAAQKIIKQLTHRDTAEVLNLLAGLTHVAATADQTTQKNIGKLQLQTAMELYLRNKGLSVSQQQQVEQTLAEAFVATGDIHKARAFYVDLIKKSPKNRNHLKTFAMLSQQCGKPQCLQEAKHTWKKLQSLEKPGTVSWLTARYGEAECCQLMHQKKECKKLLTITKILYPQLGNNELRKKFTLLQQKLKK